jgi:O-antigen/teichoic acid export membrane protein
MVILGIAGTFSDIGLAMALIQRKRLLSIHYSSVFYFNLAMALVLMLLTFFSAPLLAKFYNNEDLIALAQVASIGFILNAMNSVHIAKFKKNLQFKTLSKITFISSLLGGIIAIYFAFEGIGVWSLVIQYLSTSMMMTFLVWRYSFWRPHFGFSSKALFSSTTTKGKPLTKSTTSSLF